ncbi:MAG: sigma-70 family RNA polymerase sigma factor [Deltaproteobacteria bacterium]|nr:sigma-70 family RNA polymerase sigma factor [Deltaproteobacteria bacterium]
MIDSLAPADLTSEQAWGVLQSKLRPFVARRVREADVEDVLQEIFLRVQRGLPSVRDGQRFGAWVYRVARNTVAEHLRAVARRLPPDDQHDAGELPDEDLEQQAVEAEVAIYAALFVSMLPSPYREALTLTELEGLTQKRAAEMIGISLSGMKSRVQRGRQLLRAALEDCCEIALDRRKRVIGCEPRRDGKLPDGCCS